MQNALTLLAMVVGGFAASYLSKDDTTAITGSLVLILAILGGLLAQMIALTAVIFEPGRLSSAGIKKIGREVAGLQSLNIGLFALYLLTLASLVTVNLVLGHDKVAGLAIYGITFGVVIRIIAAALVVLAIVRTFRTLQAIRALQVVRTGIQVEDAEARERAAVERTIREAVPVEDQGGAKYGAFRDVPGASKKRTGHRFDVGPTP